MTDKQGIQIAEMAKDISYIREAMDANFKDHEEIKKAFKEGLKEKVGKSRFRPIETISYGLAGGVLFWALKQMLEVIETTKALF